MNDSPTSRLPHVDYEFECGSVTWRVRSLVLEERIGEAFRADLHLITAASAAVEDLLDRDATLTFGRGTRVRTFRGYVTQAEILGVAGEDLHARVRFEPFIARVRTAHRFRIFQDLSVPDIVTQVLARVSALRVETRLTQSYPVRDYCVQYDESDLAFVSRLLEDEGISWLLDDSGDEQMMLLVDDVAGFPGIAAEDREIRIIPDRHDEAGAESVQGIVFSHRPPAPAAGERDWDWMVAKPVVRVERHPPEASTDTHERFHPRRWSAATAPRSVQLDYEARAVRDRVGRGRSNVTAFAAGTSFELADDVDEPLPLLLVSVRHSADCPDQELGARLAIGGNNYVNEFECVPLAVPFRPHRFTPRPRIHGLQTALVTGPPTEEIHTDELGRIRVSMHWQPPSDAEAPASCWMRVGQIWAGAGFGACAIPRVGMEVLVAFLDGDPDRPICVGCLYNGLNGTPQKLPDQKTKTTLRTRSSPGGDGFNELTFEDAAGSEQVFLHAQRNLDEVVRANHTQRIGGSQTTTVARDQSCEVDGLVHHFTGKDRHEEVAHSHNLRVNGSQRVVIEGGAASTDKVHDPAEPGAEIWVNGTYLMHAAQFIAIRCGPSSIEVSPQGVSITGPLVLLDGSGSKLELAPGTAMMKSPLASVQAASSALQLDASALLSSDVQARIKVLDSRLTLDGTARLRAPTTAVEGTAVLELRSDASVAMTAPNVAITGDANVTVSSIGAVDIDGGGATATFAAGMAAICE